MFKSWQFYTLLAFLSYGSWGFWGAKTSTEVGARSAIIYSSLGTLLVAILCLSLLHFKPHFSVKGFSYGMLTGLSTGLGTVFFISALRAGPPIRVVNLDTFYYSIDYAITIIFFSLITMTVLASVIRDKRITSSTLFGAICGYLLIGLTWCFVYSLIYTLNNQAFILPHSITTDDIKTQQFIYYSFVTLSTLGYGDITPAIPVAKTFSWLQAILGQVYLTVWIARLVGLHISQSERGRKNVEKN